MQINSYINFWKKFFFYKERKGLEGFSLVELVIVLAVLSVLAAIALPSFTSVRVFLDETEAQVLAKNVLKSITMYQAKYGSFPTSWTWPTTLFVTLHREQLLWHVSDESSHSWVEIVYQCPVEPT